MSNRDILRVRHSSHLSKTPKTSDDSYYSKSDLNVTIPNSSVSSQSTRHDLDLNFDSSAHGEYYKKYEHDEVPVKDNTIFGQTNKGSLTNSDIDKLEIRIFKNVSQELQTDDCSLTSLESNIKFFKITVEKIFEKFYTNMRDFEHYKQRFQDILDKSKDGSLDDMGDFIKDMFEHIMSDNSTASLTENMKEECSCGDTYSELESTGVMEAYKNENYQTDSVADEKLYTAKDNLKIDDLINIFLIDGNPCFEIRLKERNLLSEVNFKETKNRITSHIASADNLRSYESKQVEVDNFYMGQQQNNAPDRNIPVKVSYAKKNIHLNEDFAKNTDHCENTKSFLSKICNILCKKFRKTTIG